MKRIWTKQQTKTVSIVGAGLGKLEAYRDRSDLAPAYVFAMSNVSSHLDTVSANVILVINPTMKLGWFRKHQLENVKWTAELFLCKVSYISFYFLHFMIVLPC
jgi:hypothetical protein